MALISFGSAVVTFLPSLTVEASVFDDANPYSVSFTATNAGYIPLADVGMSIGICSIETKMRDFWVTGTWRYTDRCGDPKLRLGSPKWERHELFHNEQLAITLSDVLTILTAQYRAQNPDVIISSKTLSPLTSADVVVAVGYYPWFVPWHRQMLLAFVAETQPNGKVLWKPRPMDEKGKGELDTETHTQLHFFVLPNSAGH